MGSFSAKATAQKAYADGSAIFTTARAVDGDYEGIVRTVGIEHKQEEVSGASIADGHFTATSVGCTFSGALSVRGGVFDVAVETSGADCLLQPSLSGIAVPLDDDTLAVELDTADANQSAVFILSRG